MNDGVTGNELATAQGAVRRDVNIINARGLHARAAAKFVRTAGRFQASVTVTNRDVAVSGLSIMGLMMLAAGPGTTISIAATGRDAGAALAALVELVESKFGESD
ncbi:MAG: HPr family phosphocarrier protein [Alphaproteobacteria bacterium]